MANATDATRELILTLEALSVGDSVAWKGTGETRHSATVDTTRLVRRITHRKWEVHAAKRPDGSWLVVWGNARQAALALQGLCVECEGTKTAFPGGACGGCKGTGRLAL